MKIRMAMFVLIALLASVAWAQYTKGVKTYTDVYGNVVCDQIVVKTATDLTGMWMWKVADRLHAAVIHPVNDWRFDAAFDVPGLQGGEKVTFTIGSKVVDATPDGVRGIPEGNAELEIFGDDVSVRVPMMVWQPSHNIELAIFDNNALVRELLAVPGNLWVHFIGPRGTVQFTIEPGIIRTLRKGFGQTCLGLR